MNEPTDTTALLTRLAETFPDRPAPVASLRAAAGARRRRRTRLLVGAVAVSVVLAAAGSLALARSLDSRPDDPVVVDDYPQLPSPPAGQRFAGVGRVVVPVPEEWGPQGVGCPATSQGLFVRDLARRSCVLTFPAGEVPVIGFLDPDTDAGERAAAFATEPDEVDGVPVLRGPGCPGFSLCTGSPWGDVVLIPDLDLVVVAAGRFDGDRTGRLLAGLRILPEGFVAVPEVGEGWGNGGVGNAILDVGLTYRLSPEPVLPSGRTSVYGTDPSPGTVVPVGSEVVIELDPPVVLDPDLVALARSIAQSYVGEQSPPWDVTEVWARADEGTASQEGVGSCTSGRLLRISLFGTFPVIVSPIPGGSNTPSEVDLVADPVTREVCQVQTRFDAPSDPRTPDPADTQVLDLS